MLFFLALGMAEFTLIPTLGENPTLITDSTPNTVNFGAIVMNKAMSIAGVTPPEVHFSFMIYLSDSGNLLSDAVGMDGATFNDIDTVNGVTDIRSKALESREVIEFTDSSVDITFDSAACIGRS